MISSVLLLVSAVLPLCTQLADGTDVNCNSDYREDACVLIQSKVSLHSPSLVSISDSNESAPTKNASSNPTSSSSTEGHDSDLKDEGHGTLGAEEHQGHGYLVLVFLFGCLTIGSCVTMLQKRLLKSVPYTCLLFVAGLLLAMVHHYKPRYHWLTWQAWYLSVDQWQSISPHLLFYVFLPVLVFGDAFKLNGHLVKHMLPRILLLAGPGVVLGTILTGVFTYYVLPWGWDWCFSLLLGSILSATDPVAVVSLFKSLGVSAELSMLVSGESLLNDGTAIVAFGLLLQAAKGESLTLLGSALYFFNMTVVAYILGFVLASVAVLGICVCSKGDSESDPFIQVVITICCAFVCFFFAEHEFGTSGVLTLVTAGVVMSKSVWPMFVSKHVVEVVWETAEFIANTVIFTLAGLLLGGECLSNRHHIEGADFFYLLAFYVALTVVRAVMVGLFWWPLKVLGTELSMSEGIVMVWAGLRGAIGIVMAIIVDTDPAIPHAKGAKVIFYVGGIAALTILVNAVTCGPLLQYLGMTAETEIAARKKQHYQLQMKHYADELLRNQQIGADTRFKGVQVDLVKRMLQNEFHEAHAITKPKVGREYVGFYREMLLEAVKQNYWEDINTEIIPKNSAVAQILLDSVDECLIYSDRPLEDWAIVESAVKQSLWFPGIGRLVRRSCAQFTDLLEAFPSPELLQLQKVYASLCFQEAHRKAQQTLRSHSFHADDQSLRFVIAESEDQQKKAANFLTLVQKQDPKALEFGKAKMLARFLLNAQRSKIDQLADVGMLTGKEVEEFTHAIKASQMSIMSDRNLESTKA